MEFSLSLKGNTKVFFPIINVGAALDCPSRKWCPFDKDNYKASGRRKCYAQATEQRFPDVYKARAKNEALIRSGAYDIDEIADELATAAVKWEKKRGGRPTIRINESSDLADWNINFVVHLTQAMLSRGVVVYLYSKAPSKLRKMAIKAGAVVLHSEHDFIAVKDEVEGAATGLPECGGKCGPCRICPDGGKAWILEH